MKNPVLKRFIGLLCALVLCMGCALPGAHAAQADPVMTLPRLQSLNGGNAVVRMDGGAAKVAADRNGRMLGLPDYLNALTFRLPAGTAALLPADGLETVDFTANLADLDAGLEAKVNNRKSRPKE